MAQQQNTMMLLLALLLFSSASGKVFDRCELARLLRKFGASMDHVANWVCIAKHESSFNSRAVSPANSDGSRDHGLFQINDHYWCYPSGHGCGQPCSKFEDDDITDDFQCVNKIYAETQRLRGQGFLAWTVWKPHCSGGQAAQYIQGCF